MLLTLYPLLHSCIVAVLTLYPQVFTWGCNDEGALGRETKDGEEYSPGQVLTIKDVGVVKISAGDSHTAALASNGDVYCWGVFRVSHCLEDLLVEVLHGGLLLLGVSHCASLACKHELFSEYERGIRGVGLYSVIMSRY